MAAYGARSGVIGPRWCLQVPSVGLPKGEARMARMRQAASRSIARIERRLGPGAILATVLPGQRWDREEEPSRTGRGRPCDLGRPLCGRAGGGSPRWRGLRSERGVGRRAARSMAHVRGPVARRRLGRRTVVSGRAATGLGDRQPDRGSAARAPGIGRVDAPASVAWPWWPGKPPGADTRCRGRTAPTEPAGGNRPPPGCAGHGCRAVAGSVETANESLPISRRRNAS